ncbi:alpha-(1-_6)-mannopyranosyltransferase A [Corynebacterium halotolerans]|nr:alpha-(1->6)-mannopyranosyltransferase A [Corynebacterium halotolerans]
MLPRALPLGVVGAVLLTLGSFGGGATRNRGGLLEAAGLDFLAYGHGGGISNAVFWAGLLCLLGAWVLLGRDVIRGLRRSTDDGARLRGVRTALWAWVVPLLLAAPMLSRDVYSYLMQGAMLRDGFDPYSQGAAINPGPYLLEVSHDWRNTTTPYGPLHLWIGEGVTRLVGDNVTAGVLLYKLISVAGFAAIAWAVPRIAQRLGGDPGLALWLGVANPVMVLHMVGGMHNESVMVGLVSLGLLAGLRKRFLIGVALIAVAVSLKATAAIALPFVVWMATNHYAGEAAGTGRRVTAFLVTGFIGVVETLGVVAVVTWASGSSWGWLSEITGNSKVINPLALPTLLTDVSTPLIQVFYEDFDYNVALAVFRSIGMVAMLVGLVVTWWLFRQNDRRAIMGITAAYQVAFVFNSVTLPWYYASVLSLVGTFRPPAWVLRVATGASLVVALSFTGSGNHQLYNLWWMGAAGIAAWLLTEFIFDDRAELSVQAETPAAPATPEAPADAGER